MLLNFIEVKININLYENDTIFLELCKYVPIKQKNILTNTEQKNSFQFKLKEEKNLKSICIRSLQEF